SSHAEAKAIMASSTTPIVPRRWPRVRGGPGSCSWLAAGAWGFSITLGGGSGAGGGGATGGPGGRGRIGGARGTCRDTLPRPDPPGSGGRGVGAEAAGGADGGAWFGRGKLAGRGSDPLTRAEGLTGRNGGPCRAAGWLAGSAGCSGA